ncbi:transposase [Corynebacterium sp. zg331]|nr:transposase [Corynebacterium sp. zg331]
MVSNHQRLLINDIFFRIRTGCPWRDTPNTTAPGGGSTTYLPTSTLTRVWQIRTTPDC